MRFVLCTFVGERYMVGLVEDAVDLSDKNKNIPLKDPITVHVSMDKSGSVHQNLMPAYLVDTPQEVVYVSPQTVEVVEEYEMTSSTPPSRLLTTYLDALTQKRAQRAGLVLPSPQNHGNVLPMKQK